MATPSSTTTNDDEQLTQQLNQIRSQLNKKQTFHSSLSSLKSLLISSYSTSSPSTQSLFHDILSRASTVSLTRYSSPPFLLPTLDLLSTALELTTLPSRRSHLLDSISSLRQSLPSDDDVTPPPPPPRGRFLFEGHLTVDPEPPLPNWLALQTLVPGLEQGPISDDVVEALEMFMIPDNGATTGRVAPPASREVVEKLKVVVVDEVVIEKVGDDGECCICKEKFGVGDEMQEMPCNHLFHRLCLKPWLDEHNSCPICRHELRTDDHKYESWKEREKELEEERRGAANAVRGGEFMYI